MSMGLVSWLMSLQAPTRPGDGDVNGIGTVISTNEVLVIDDHALLAESVVMALRASDIPARSLHPGLPEIAAHIEQCEPALVLLDLYLTESAEPSIQLLGHLSSLGIKVLVVTATADRIAHGRCVEAGAVGIVEKSQPIETLIEAVEHALRNETVMSKGRSVELLTELDTVRRRRSETSPFESLTAKEREVFFALTQGHPARRIARDLGVSVVTVRTHIRSILHKLDVHSQLEAVSMAARLRWFSDRRT